MRRLVIANRGEIARRILRAARDRGYRVAVVSTPDDRDALVRKEVDEVLEVGSFLDPAAIVSAARRWGATALHPGYGFLSENAGFSDLVESVGIVFVGPLGETMRRLGNKERARELASEQGVPVLEALSSEEAKDRSVEALSKHLDAKGIEAPYLVKAAGGGGGRGMRVVDALADLPRALERASEEALSGFSDGTVFVERYVPEPRHVEIQVFGDGAGGGIVLGERECSLQRRHQKVIEEAPSPVVDRARREQMGRAALALVRATRYRGAGTVEFLLDLEGRFYFLEVNTRLQVEHPVTELAYDVDLVAAQLALAEDRWPSTFPDPSALGMLEPCRFAIEARVLAEDPRSGFLPTPGPLVRYREPAGPGLRVDSGVTEGSRIHPQFDSLIAKVIASGATREEAIDRLSAGLERMIVHGARTNLPFLQAVLRHPDFRSARFSTTWIAAHLEELNRPLVGERLLRRLSTPGFRERLSLALHGAPILPEGPAAARFLAVSNEYARVGSELEERPLRFELDRATGDFRLRDSEGEDVAAVATAVGGAEIALTVRGETLLLDDPTAQTRRHAPPGRGDGEVRAPMAGKVLEVHVREGDLVEEGNVLAVVESMKMQLEVSAPFAGRVEKVLVEGGEVLDGPDLLAVIAP
jgi:acetyl/propionyl-CoA carboxylase alpha subunit